MWIKCSKNQIFLFVGYSVMLLINTWQIHQLWHRRRKVIYNENGTLTLIISSFTSHSCLRMKMTKCPDTSHMFMKVQGFRPPRVSLIQKFLNNVRHILIVLNVLQLRYICILYKSKIETGLSKIWLMAIMCSGVKFQQCNCLKSSLECNAW